MPSDAKAERRAIVVGAGMAGICATFELLERGCYVTVIDKNPKLPTGASAKASSGMCAAGSDLYGMKSEDISSLMVNQDDKFMQGAKSDVEWLLTRWGKGSDELVPVDTPGPNASQLVGSKKGLIGQVLCAQAVMHFAKLTKTEKLRIIRGAEVKQLLQEDDKDKGWFHGALSFSEKKVTGVLYSDGDGTDKKEFGAVVLATGGYSGLPGPSSLLHKNRPDLKDLGKCSDAKVDGRGLLVAQHIGAAVERLNEVICYPLATDLPDEKDKSNQLKIVLSMGLLAAGAIILDATGNRICDEKTTAPEELAQKMLQKDAKNPFTLVLPKSAYYSESAEWLVDFYIKIATLTEKPLSELAREMGISDAQLKTQNRMLLQQSTVYAGKIHPAVYTCAGGLKVDKASGSVVSASGAAIPGLFAAGEVAAGPSQQMYQKPGVPLLHCVVSGKMAGCGAAKQLFDGVLPESKDLSSVLEFMPTVEAKDAPAEDNADIAKVDKAKLEAMTKEELIEMCADLQARPAASAPAPSGPAGISMEDVAQHNTEQDAWVVVNGLAIDVTKWISVHPGGKEAITIYMGKDATSEWNEIHRAAGGSTDGTKSFIEKQAAAYPDNAPKIMGAIGGGGGGGGGGAAAGGDDGIDPAEVAKHKTKDDLWIIINGKVIDVTGFVDKHPGGIPILIANAGTDASTEWNTIHKPDFIETRGVPGGAKILGKVKGGGAAGPPPGPVGMPEPDVIPGEGGVAGWPGAIIYAVLGLLKNVGKTVFGTGNLVYPISSERLGMVRSALFLVLFTVLHSSDNQFTALGKKQYNGMSQFLATTMQQVNGFALFDIYIGLSVLLHVMCGIKRSYDQNFQYTIGSGKWYYFLTGCCILFFLISHMCDFRFAEYVHEEGYVLWETTYLPKYGVRIGFEKPPFVFFYDDETTGVKTQVRDLWTMCDRAFQSPVKVAMYVGFIAALVGHLWRAWPKLIGSAHVEIPVDHKPRVALLGQVAACACGLLYVSVPIRFYLGVMKPEGILP